MKLNKTQIRYLNFIATQNFDQAKAMLDGINMVLNTEYGWLAGRVVFFDDPTAPDYIKYCHAHDAYAYAEE